MNISKLKHILYGGILFLLFAIFSIFILKKDAENSIPAGVYGKPEIYTTLETIDGFHVDQILDDNDRIYLLDSHNGILQIYDLNGVYQQTVSFYSTLNGAFQMAIVDGHLYVRDKEANIYLFQNGLFQSFLIRDYAEDFRKSVDFEVNSATYYLRHGSVWKAASDGNICVIQGTPGNGFFQSNLWLFAAFAVVAAVAFMRFLGQRRTGEGTEPLKK